MAIEERLTASLEATGNISNFLDNVADNFEKVAGVAAGSVGPLGRSEEALEDIGDEADKTSRKLNELTASALASSGALSALDGMDIDVDSLDTESFDVNEGFLDLDSDLMQKLHDISDTNIDPVDLDVASPDVDEEERSGLFKWMSKLEVPDLSSLRGLDDRTVNIDVDMDQAIEKIVALKAILESLPERTTLHIDVEEDFDRDSLKERFSDLAGGISSKVNLHRREVSESVSNSRSLDVTRRVSETVRRVKTQIDSKGLDGFLRRLDGLRDRSLRVGIETDTSALRGLQTRLSGLRDRSLRVLTETDTSALRRLQAKLSTLRDRSLHVVTETDTSALRRLQGKLSTLRDRVVHVDADVDGFAPVAALKKSIGSLRDREINVDADVDGFGAIASLKASLATLRDKTVHVGVDRDRLRGIASGLVGGLVAKIGSIDLPSLPDLPEGASSTEGLTASVGGITTAASGSALIGAGAGLVGVLASLVSVLGGLTLGAGGLAGAVGLGLFANLDTKDIESFKKALDTALDPLRNPQFREISLGVLQAAVNLVGDAADVFASLGDTVEWFLSAVGGTWDSVRPDVILEFKNAVRELAPYIEDLVSGSLEVLPGLFNFMTDSVSALGPLLGQLISSMIQAAPTFALLGRFIGAVLIPILTGMFKAFASLSGVMQAAWDLLGPLLKDLAPLFELLGGALAGILAVAIGAGLISVIGTLVGVLGALVEVVGPVVLAIGAAIAILFLLKDVIISIFQKITKAVIGILNKTIDKVNWVLPSWAEIDKIEPPTFGEGKKKNDRKRLPGKPGSDGSGRPQVVVNQNNTFHGDAVGMDGLDAKTESAVEAALSRERNAETPLSDE